MNRSRLNFLVNLITLLVMWALATVGLLIKYVLPPGTGRRLEAWGMNRHEWGEVHFYLGVVLIGLLAVHVLLHWSWVCATARRLLAGSESGQGVSSRARRTAWGLGLVVILLVGTGGSLWCANRSVTSVEFTPDGQKGGEPRGAAVGRRRAQRVEPDATEEDLDGCGDCDACFDHDPKPSEPTSKAMRPSAEGVGRAEIRGSTTLTEAASILGMSLDQLRRRLNLPADVGPDERIGPLGKRYGFNVWDVRAISGAPASRASGTLP